jgi:hypothetical protein
VEGCRYKHQETPTSSLEAWVQTKKTMRTKILNLTIQNEALSVKNLDKFFNKHNIPWVDLVWDNYYNSRAAQSSQKMGIFLWNHILKTLAKYKDIT